MGAGGQRADLMVVAQGLATTRSRAQALIMAGQICLTPSGRRVDKVGTLLPVASVLTRRGGEPIPFVSRGGLKLDAALSHWQVPVAGAIAVDVGASTGGFTDCLLQRGARRVFALDVGHNQLDYRLRSDRRVSSKEGCNVRTAPAATLPVRCDIAVADVSFISLVLLLPAMLRWLADDGWIICLVKPQFELTPSSVGKGGIVREPALRARAVARVEAALAGLGWLAGPAIDAPICGHGGNQEYLLAARRGRAPQAPWSAERGGSSSCPVEGEQPASRAGALSSPMGGITPRIRPQARGTLDTKAPQTVAEEMA